MQTEDKNNETEKSKRKKKLSTKVISFINYAIDKRVFAFYFT